MANSIKSVLWGATPASLKAMTDNDLIALGKKAQGFMNYRLEALEKAGYASAQTTSGLKPKSVKEINTRHAAYFAVKHAKVLLNNPLSTPSKINKLMRESGVVKKGKKLTKIIIDPETGKPKVVTRGTPGKTWTRAAFRGFELFKKWCRQYHPEWSSEQVFRNFLKVPASESPIDYWDKRDLKEWLFNNYATAEEEDVERLYGKYKERTGGWDGDKVVVGASWFWSGRTDEIDAMLQLEANFKGFGTSGVFQ